MNFFTGDYWDRARRERTAIIPRLVTDAQIEPVNSAEAKAQCRIDSSTDDTYIDGLIKGARQLVESRLNRSCITTTWRVTLDGFPGGNGVIELPRPRLIDVTSIVYTDQNSVSQTLSASGYTVDAQSEPGRVVPAYTLIWPQALGHINTVAITYTAGYGATAASVPQTVKQAISLIVGHWFANREAMLVGTISKEIELGVDSLLATEMWTPS